MAEQAKITSIDAIAAFRGRLVMFMENATRALEDVDSELRRTRVWLDSETLPNWQRELKLRLRKLEAAEQELLTARLSTLRESETVQQMAVRKARASVREAEEKIRLIKRWSRDFDGTISPLARHLHQLRHHLGRSLPNAAAQLSEIVKTLDAYAELGRVAPAAPPASLPDTPDAELEVADGATPGSEPSEGVTEP